MSGSIKTQGTKFGIKAVTENVSVTFNAATGTIERAAGDWTDKFTEGMIVTTTDATNAGPYVITDLSATVMTLAGQTRGYAGTPDFEETSNPVMTTDAVAASFDIVGYQSIGEIVSYDGPGGEASEIDCTNMDSRAKEFKMGLADEGTISFDLNFVPGNPGQVAFRKARRAQSQQSFILMFPDESDTSIATHGLFEGFAKGWSNSGASESKVTAKATIRVTGPVTWSDED